MSLRRAPSILQSVVQMRNWLIENVPGTDSMLGYDLFLKLGNDASHGQTLRLSDFAGGLPYALDVVAGQLQRFETAGMVVLTNDADQGLLLQATPRFITLLDQYSVAFESK